MLVTPILQTSLGEQIARELRRQIVTRRIEPGTRVVEERLATDFQVSRGPIRDALKILAAEGLVRPNGRSAEITGLTAVDIDELFSLRQMLEHTALTMAMNLDPDALKMDLDVALKEMETAVETGQAEDFAVADLHFHTSFYTNARHSRLTATWNQYRPTIELVLLVSRETYADLTPSIESHYVLARAIDNGDPTVGEELRWHIDNTRQRVRRLYEEADPGGATAITTTRTKSG